MSQVRLWTEVYNRGTSDGRPRYYVRFFGEPDPKPLKVKSLGPSVTSKVQADREAGRLVASLQDELLRIHNARLCGLEKAQENEDKIREQPFSQYVVNFWTEEASEYLASMKNAGRGLSAMYVANRLSKAKAYLATYQPFDAPLSKITLLRVEQFFKHLRVAKVDNNLIDPILKTIQRPVSWAVERNLVDAPFTLKTIVIPKPVYEERSLLTPEQVTEVYLMPWVPLRIIPTKTGAQIRHKTRVRLTAGEPQVESAPVDVREKAIVFTAFMTGLRRGELRALRWENVSLDKKQIEVVKNIVPKESIKGPKYGSKRSVGIPDPLAEILQELKEQASALGRAGDQDFVFFNSKPHVPMSTTTITRAFDKVVEYLGIDVRTRKEIRLVLHSGRHFFSQQLAIAVGATIAMMSTGHKDLRVFNNYSLHADQTAIRKSRDAFNSIGSPRKGSEEVPAENLGSDDRPSTDDNSV